MLSIISIFLLGVLLVCAACSHFSKNELSEAEISDLKRNATANCRVLDTSDYSLHPLKPVEQIQKFETQIGDIKVIVTMEDPFIVSSDSSTIVFRWRYGLLSPDAAFESFRQETYLSRGLASFGEFLVAFSSHHPPNYEMHIASFQNGRGRSLKLYCMTTIIESKSNKVITLEKESRSSLLCCPCGFCQEGY